MLDFDTKEVYCPFAREWDRIRTLTRYVRDNLAAALHSKKFKTPQEAFQELKATLLGLQVRNIIHDFQTLLSSYDRKRYPKKLSCSYKVCFGFGEPHYYISVSRGGGEVACSISTPKKSM